MNHLTECFRDNNLKRLIRQIGRLLTLDELEMKKRTVEKIKSCRFLYVHMTEGLFWTLNTPCLAKKTQQCLHFQWRLKRANLPLLNLTTYCTTKRWQSTPWPFVSLFGKELPSSWPQDPTVDCETSWKDHQGLSTHYQQLMSTPTAATKPPA